MSFSSTCLNTLFFTKSEVNSTLIASLNWGQFGSYKAVAKLGSSPSLTCLTFSLYSCSANKSCSIEFGNCTSWYTLKMCPTCSAETFSACLHLSDFASFYLSNLPYTCHNMLVLHFHNLLLFYNLWLFYPLSLEQK